MRAFAALAFALVTASIAAPAPAQTVQSIEAPTWRSLQRFRSEAEFHRYLADVRDAARRARGASLQKQAEEECPPEFYPCEPPPPELGEDSIMVTGSRIPAQAFAATSPVTQVSSDSVSGETSITNVQNLGVDEGDIVKLWGRYLIVLQDGRLFTVDIGGEHLRFVDRENVYRSANAGVWYDEMLVQDRRIVVTGYNYSEAATEFSIFTINDRGELAREAVYFLASNDYYDIENYASRLVNGNLVIYTPLAVGQMQAGARAQWPLVRRWLSESGHQAATTSGRALYDATDIYRPIQATFDPVVHTISVCPLGAARSGDELECDSTAVVAPPGREFYVSTSHIYLWTWPVQNHEWDEMEGCAPNESAGVQSALFQVPLTGGQLRAQFVRGAPYDQLSMDANAESFRALSVWIDTRCRGVSEGEEGLPLRYFSTPLSAFSATPRPLADDRYTEIPSVGRALENRFTGDYLVYGGRDSWYSYAPDPSAEVALTSRIVAVPTANPAAHTSFEAPHNILRVERAGDDIVLSGYRDARGLSLSFVSLRNTPRIASTVLLPDRYESEGRSHAFNAVVNAQGEGVLGLATVMRRAQSGRWWWRSSGSDVSFVSFDANGQLADSGAMRGANPVHPDYNCEVSCIDWYGNTRALFIRGRIFALAATELIEGRLQNGRVEELQRINLTQPPPGQRRRISSNQPKE